MRGDRGNFGRKTFAEGRDHRSAALEYEGDIDIHWQNFKTSSSLTTEILSTYLVDIFGLSSIVAGGASIIEVGDRVEYQAIGGGNVENSTTTGVIVDIIEEKKPAGETGVQVNASEDDPQARYLIRNDNVCFSLVSIPRTETYKETPYKADNLVKVIEEA
ncbi:hypothetical protein PQX77_003104 [Marasmius sp. AFHP31]|nr:hypothetical protein PQX77_003104 [Marasmius sp. AFHP31]